MRHCEFSLYKRDCGKRVVWYARFWNYERRQWWRYRSTEVEAKGKRGRYEAEKKAIAMLENMRGAAGEFTAKYVLDFWQPQGRHSQEKLLYSGKPYSSSYLEGNATIAKNEIARYAPLAGRPLCEITAGMVRDYRIILFAVGFNTPPLGAVQCCIATDVSVVNPTVQ